MTEVYILEIYDGEIYDLIGIYSDNEQAISSMTIHVKSFRDKGFKYALDYTITKIMIDEMVYGKAMEQSKHHWDREKL